MRGKWILNKVFPSLDEAKIKCDELGASDCNSIIYTNEGHLMRVFKMISVPDMHLKESNFISSISF